MIASVKERFNQPSYKTFASLENLLLGVINNGPYEEEMQHLTNIYDDNVDANALIMEFDLFKTIFKDTTPICFDDIHKHLKTYAGQERLLIPNVIIVSQLLLVNPATSATPDDNFPWHAAIRLG